MPHRGHLKRIISPQCVSAEAGSAALAVLTDVCLSDDSGNESRSLFSARPGSSRPMSAAK